MYLPAAFAETRIDVMHALIATHPLGALAMHGPEGLAADHIPFEISAPSADAPLGVLRAHVARANPLWRRGGEQVLALFQGPQAYVSPAFYEQKQIDGKVVPTWNYALVHAHGTLRAIEDPVWLYALLQRLTQRHEEPRAEPWSIDDAPRAYIEALLKAVVGIEIVIERLEGKWKASQNRTAGDQRRVHSGLAGHPEGKAMADLMRPPATLE
ncbi:MAG TPA: FMN-binding negative transcriptional regulator [Telluria sp.]